MMRRSPYLARPFDRLRRTGTVCVAKAYRGKGIFYKMYDHLKETTNRNFEILITEVSAYNKRSLRAHKNQGFKNILSYKATDGHPREILLWDFSQ